MPLPPVVQQFSIDAAPYLAGIDEMLARTGELADVIERVSTATADLSGASDAVAATEDRIDESTVAANEAIARQSDLVRGLVGASDELAAAVDETAAAIDRQNVAMDETAGSAAKADESTGALGTHGKILFLGLAAAVGYGVVKAAEFQSALEKLHTQAGVSQSALKGLGDGVLQLAGQVGESPDSLVESLYHVESNFESLGIKGPKALSLVRTAAEGAQTGGADLVDVTNALTAAVASGIPGVKNFHQAMGALNAIVGAGDMQMQDLADAFGTGMVAVVKGYGLSLQDVGAALDVFGDNNIRGAKAGTDLRMSVQALAVPMATGAAELKKLGMNSHTLADDMQHGGLLKALDDLTTRMHKAGITAKQQGNVITTIFGKRAGAGLSVLLDQMDRLRSKYPAITKGAHDFGDAWKATQATVQQKFKEFETSLEALAVSFGQVLLPAVTKVMGYLDKFFALLEKNRELAAVAGGILAIAVAVKLMSGVEAIIGGVSAAIGTIGEAADTAVPEVTALDVALDSNVIALVLVAVLALGVGLYELYKHCKTVRDAVADVVSFFKSAWTATMHAAGAVVNWFISGPLAFFKQELKVFEKFWAQNGQEIEKIVKAAWTVISGIFSVEWDIIVAVFKAEWAIFEGIFKAGWAIISGLVKMAWDLIAETIRTGVAVILDIVGAFLQLIQGHWSKAWDDLKAATSTLLHGLEDMIKTVVGGFASILYNAGKDLIQGFINGIKSMIGSVGSIMSDIGHTAVSSIKAVLGIFSPSKVMAEIGHNIGQGLINGLEGTKAQVKSAAAKLASDVKQAFNDGLIGQGGYSAITTFLDRDNIRLQKLATDRTKILSEIKAAKAYAASVTSNAESSAGLANLASVSNAQNGGALYSGDMESDLKASLSQIRQFESVLRRLTKLGLDKNLLNQIVQMGPAQGLQVAQALLDGPVSVIKQMDATQTAINSASKSLGQQTADDMYDSGKQAGKGFLSGLEGQQKNIEKTMKKIAESMVKTIRKELGISSPSKVARYHGQMWSEGLALGIDDGDGRVAAASKRLTASLTGGVRGGGVEAAGGTAGSSRPQIGPINVHVSGFVGSERQLATQLYDVIQAETLKYNRRNGIGNNGLSLASGRFG